VSGWDSLPPASVPTVSSDVIVGRALSTHTPVFAEDLREVILRPYWNVPPSILRTEILPQVRRDAGYLQKHDMEIVPSGGSAAVPATPENIARLGRGLDLRQRPGPGNSLGLAKFIFPNDENVYMHGTPAQQLFSRVRRDFSHGCIRLEDPGRFAAWVLRDQSAWTRERIEAAMQGERPTRVNLKEPLTVVIFYDTVHVNSEDVVFFVEDIYGHDRALDAALTRGYPYPLKGT